MILGQSGMEKAKEFGETKVKCLEEEMRNRKLRQEATAKQEGMKYCKFDEIKYSTVVEFLHHAVSALLGLAAVMQ